VYTFGVVWQVWHVSPVWRPEVMGNAVCVNRPCFHDASVALWHASHVVGNPAVM
jgi:hypothetical protein